MNVPLFRYLDTVGDGTGTKNAIGNYSGGAQIFKITAPAGKGYSIYTFLVHVAGASNFALSGYGTIAAPGLTNGWTMQAIIGGVTYQLLDNLPIKTNDDLAHFSPLINHLNFNGAGDSLIAPMMAEQFGLPLLLEPGDTFQVTLHDDFSTLTSQHFVIHGYTNV